MLAARKTAMLTAVLHQRCYAPGRPCFASAPSTNVADYRFSFGDRPRCGRAHPDLPAFDARDAEITVVELGASYAS